MTRWTIGRRTLFALVILPELHALEGGAASDQFVGELGLMRLVLAIHLLVGVLGITCDGLSVSDAATSKGALVIYRIQTL